MGHADFFWNTGNLHCLFVDSSFAVHTGSTDVEIRNSGSYAPIGRCPHSTRSINTFDRWRDVDL